MNASTLSLNGCSRWLAAAAVRGAGALTLWWLSAALGVAGINNQITEVSVPNDTGYVIESDVLNGANGYDRNQIQARGRVTFTKTATGDSSFEYTLRFFLVDESGVKQPLSGGSDHVDVVRTVTFTPAQPAGAQQLVVFDAGLTPSGILNPYVNHRVEAQLLRRPVGNVLPPSTVGAGQTGSDAYRRIIQFKGLISDDAAVHVVPFVEGGTWQTSYLVKTDPQKDDLQVVANLEVHRYDGFAANPVNTDIRFRLSLQLRDAETDALIPLADSTIDWTNAMPSHFNASPKKPMVSLFNPTLNFRPAEGQQLDPRRQYRLTVSVGHFESPGVAFPVLGNSQALAPRQILHFNGNLMFGAVTTRFTSIANAPQILENQANGVRTTLAVDGGSGVVLTDASYTYGDGTALSVRLLTNGVAQLLSGTVVPSRNGPDPETLGTVSYLRQNLRLSATGAVADLAVRLPAGLGYRTLPNGRVAESVVKYFNAVLNATLDPVAATLTAPGPMWGVEESKPLWFEATGLTWFLQQSRFEFVTTGSVKYVRAEEYDALDALPVPAQDRRKPSNDLYWRYVSAVSGNVAVEAQAGRGARMDAVLSFDSGAILAHRPLNAVVQWSKGGTMRIDNDLVVPEDSTLESALSVFVGYDPNCEEAACGSPAPMEMLQMNPTDERLRFTPDGGLVAPGILEIKKGLKWGWIPKQGRPAYETAWFTNAGFHMSGMFLRADQGNGSAVESAGVLLNTGVRADQAAQVERPGTAAYLQGNADYPGLNFRVSQEPTKRAESVVAGTATGTYPLTSRVKYYVRAGGVSGIHEAINGSFPTNLTLYGYPFTFTTYGLGFLGNENVESRTAGSVSVPYPSEFTQAFERLKLDCLGGLKEAELPADQAEEVKQLKYWKADFITRQLNFDRKADDFCDPGKGFLTLGVHAWAGVVKDPLSGTWGFFPDGNLITSADCAEEDGPLDLPFDSRLKLPTQIQVPAGGGAFYAATPVNDAYLNDYRFQTNGTGFMNLALKLDVPLFEDLRVHAHTSAMKDDPEPPVHLMGGWPDEGFGTDTQNFFTVNPFDAGNHGLPEAPELTLAKYRSGESDTSTKYRVRAQKLWMERVRFDYPLKWNGTTKQFVGVEPKKIDLFVVSVEHHLKHLNHESAEISFGAQYDGFPVANIANFVFEKLEGYEELLEGVVSTEILKAGNLALEELLSTNHRDLFKGAFDKSMPPAMDALHAALLANWDPAARNWKQPVAGVIAPLFAADGAVRKGVMKPMEFSEGVPLIMEEVNLRLKQVRDMIGEIRKVTKVAGSGVHEEFLKVAVKGAQTYAKKFDDAEFADEVEKLAEKSGPALDNISEAAANLDELLAALEKELAKLGKITLEIEGEVGKVQGALDQTFVKMQGDIVAWSGTVKVGLDDPFLNQTPAALKSIFRQKCEDRFHGSVAAEISQRVFKQWFYELDERIRSAMDTAFAELNGVLREALAPIFSAIDQRVEEMLGEDVGKTLGAAELKGHAHVKGDSITLLRLDGKLEMNLSDKMKLAGYLQVKELNSENTAAECLPSTGKTVEVTAGAEDVSLEWAYPGLRASLNSKFVIENLPGSTRLRGMGAGFELTGKLKFGNQFIIEELGAAMMFGAEENYFSAALAMKVGKGFGAKGGVMFGRTCSLLPFFWDQDVAKVLGDPPFTGAYGYGEFTIPINQLIGIKSTCFFTLTATVGSGIGVFAEGPTYVAKMKLGVHGEVLCIVSVTGEIVLVGVSNPSGPRLLGSGKLEGTIGYCPLFCIKFKKTASMQYENGKWSKSVQ